MSEITRGHKTRIIIALEVSLFKLDLVSQEGVINEGPSSAYVDIEGDIFYTKLEYYWGLH